MISDQVNIINFVKLDRNCVYLNSGLNINFSDFLFQSLTASTFAILQAVQGIALNRVVDSWAAASG